MIRKIFQVIRKEPIICAPMIVWALSFELLGFMIPTLMTDPFQMSGWFLGMSFLKMLFVAMTILLTAFTLTEESFTFSTLIERVKNSFVSLMILFVLVELLPRVAMIWFLGDRTVEDLLNSSSQFSWVYLLFSMLWGVLLLSFMMTHQYILIERQVAFRAMVSSARFVRRHIRLVTWLLLQILVFGFLGLYLQVFLILGPEWFNGFVAVIRGAFLATIYGMVTVFFVEHSQPTVNTLIE